MIIYLADEKIQHIGMLLNLTDWLIITASSSRYKTVEAEPKPYDLRVHKTFSRAPNPQKWVSDYQALLNDRSFQTKIFQLRTVEIQPITFGICEYLSFLKHMSVTNSSLGIHANFLLSD